MYLCLFYGSNGCEWVKGNDFVALHSVSNKYVVTSRVNMYDHIHVEIQTANSCEKFINYVIGLSKIHQLKLWSAKKQIVCILLYRLQSVFIKNLCNIYLSVSSFLPRFVFGTQIAMLLLVSSLRMNMVSC